MTSETTRYETYQKDSYNISFGMIGGRKNKYNSPGHGKPSEKPGKPRKQGRTGHNHNHNHNHNDDDNDDNDDDNHHGQSQPPHQGVFQPAPGAYACAYAVPYPYQCPPPPPYQNQLAVGGYHGDYHAPGYPGSFLPHQGGGYGNHGGGHMKDVGLVGAAVGVASFGIFKLLRERRRYGGRY